MVSNLLKRYWLTMLGIVLGALGGFLYWKFIGCNSGSCPITSSPVNSAIWSAAMGGLLLSMFKNKENKENEKTE